MAQSAGAYLLADGRRKFSKDWKRQGSEAYLEGQGTSSTSEPGERVQVKVINQFSISQKYECSLTLFPIFQKYNLFRIMMIRYQFLFNGFYECFLLILNQVLFTFLEVFQVSRA
jgi:hypothetical protein